MGNPDAGPLGFHYHLIGLGHASPGEGSIYPQPLSDLNEVADYINQTAEAATDNGCTIVEQGRLFLLVSVPVDQLEGWSDVPAFEQIPHDNSTRQTNGSLNVQ